MSESNLEESLARMREDWDARALENARHFVATGKSEWADEEFFASGEQTVRDQILTDMINICAGKDPKAMVLEIGCGAGRVTRALGKLFGSVYAVDVSGEMIKLAREATVGFPNVFVYQNNGMDLSILPPISVDFAFSTIVFQHIPSVEVVCSYVREVGRLLRPGALFKFQVQGGELLDLSQIDTWIGVTFSPEQANEMAEQCGFQCRHCSGAGTQDFWLWYFKA